MTIGRTHSFQFINRAGGAILCSIDHECGGDCVGDTKLIVSSQEISGLEIIKNTLCSMAKLEFSQEAVDVYSKRKLDVALCRLQIV